MVGPKLLSRFSTRPFSLHRNVYLMFAYHKIDRTADLRVLAKPVDAEDEAILFEAPKLSIQSSRWFREVRRLPAGAYSYVIIDTIT